MRHTVFIPVFVTALVFQFVGYTAGQGIDLPTYLLTALLGAVVAAIVSAWCIVLYEALS